MDGPPVGSRRAPHPVDVHVGQRLRELRKARGLPLAVVAAAVGVTIAQLRKYERAENRICAARVLKFALYFGIRIDDMFPPQGGGRPNRGRAAKAGKAHAGSHFDNIPSAQVRDALKALASELSEAQAPR